MEKEWSWGNKAKEGNEGLKRNRQEIKTKKVSNPLFAKGMLLKKRCR